METKQAEGREDGEDLNDQTPAVNDCWKRIGVWGHEEPRCHELERYIHCTNCPVYAETGRSLLDRPIPSGYTQEWSTQLADSANESVNSTSPMVIFRIGSEWLSLSTRVFQEVVEMRAMHRIPNNQSTVLRGLVNIRGELQICASLGRLLGFDRRFESEARPDDEIHSGNVYARLVVVKHMDGRYAFPVSEVCGIYRFSESDIQGIPATAEYGMSNYLRGLIRWEDKHVGCLDEELMFSALGRKLS